MGAPVPEMEAVENESAEALLSSLKTISAKERRKHASVFNYWLSIRGNREFPPIRDLDPLEISDAGPSSILLEMIGGGDNADIRHLGQAIRTGVPAERLSDAPNPSLLSCIHGKLPIVAACRQAFAFEEEFATNDGTRRCWVTLLPFSANGAMVDFVYGFVSLDGDTTSAQLVEDEQAPVEDSPTPEQMAVDDLTVPFQPEDDAPEVAKADDPFVVPLGPLDEDPEAIQPVEAGSAAPENVVPFEAEVEPDVEPVEAALGSSEELPHVEFAPEAEIESPLEPVAQTPEEPEGPYEPEIEGEETVPEQPPGKPGFSARILEGLASFGGFYGQGVPIPSESQDLDEYEAAEAEVPVDPEAEVPAEPEAEAPTELVAEEQTLQPVSEVEGSLQSKLSDVRAKAEEAREAQIRSEIALIEGLSAAYDFALDAEQQPEEYLKLVEAQGMKIQLRQPMKPVVKLGFDSTFDDATIAQLEMVLAWALKHDLPRGSLAERVEAEGGLAAILNS